MDESKRKALLAYRPQLIRCLIIEHFIADLHECAGGVLNDVEEDAIVSKENNRAKVYEFFRILLTKGNDAFEKFCLVMESDPSHKEWAEKLRHKASENELALVRESSLIPSLINEYRRLKDTFVRICNGIREPSLQEMKTYCVDIIAFAREERRLSRVEDDLHQCQTIGELANILFRRLCTWITFDFLENLLEYYRIQLKHVRFAVEAYKEKMCPIIEEKLKALTKLQSEYPDECESREGFLRIIAKHHLDPHGISIDELLAARNFLCHKLKIRRELLQVLTTFLGSVSIVLLTIRELEPAILTAVENSKDDLFGFGILSITVGSHPPILTTPPVVEVIAPIASSSHHGPKECDSGVGVTTEHGSDSDHPPRSVGGQPTRSVGDQPTRSVGDQPTRSVGGQPTRSVGGQPTRSVGDQPTRSVGDQPTRSVGGQPTRSVGGQPTRSVGDQPTRSVGDQPTRSVGDQPTRSVGDQPIRSVGDQPTRSVGGQPTRSAGHQPTRSAKDEPSWSVWDEPPRSFGDQPTRNDEDEPPRSVGDQPTRNVGDQPTRSVWDESPRSVGGQPTRSVGDQPSRSVKDQSSRSARDQPPRSVKDQPPRSARDQPPRSVKDQPPRSVKDQPPRSVKDQPPRSVRNQPSRRGKHSRSVKDESSGSDTGGQSRAVKGKLSKSVKDAPLQSEQCSLSNTTATRTTVNFPSKPKPVDWGVPLVPPLPHHGPKEYPSDTGTTTDKEDNASGLSGGGSRLLLAATTPSTPVHSTLESDTATITSDLETLTEDDVNSEVPCTLGEIDAQPKRDDHLPVIHTFVDTHTLSKHAKVITCEQFICWEDPRVQIDVGRLNRTMSKSRSIYDGNLLCTSPSSKDSLWDEAEKDKLKVQIQKPTPKTQKEGSQPNIKQMMLRLIHTAEQPGCLVVASCDKEYKSLLMVALEKRWSVDLWTWSKVFSEDFVKRSEDPDSLLKVHLLDGITKNVILVEDDLRPEDFRCKELVEILEKHGTVIRVSSAGVVNSKSLSWQFRQELERKACFPAYYCPVTKEGVKGDTSDFLAVFMASKGDASFQLDKFVQKLPTVKHLSAVISFVTFRRDYPDRHARILAELQKRCKDKPTAPVRPVQMQISPKAPAHRPPPSHPIPAYSAFSRNKTYPCIYYHSSSCSRGYRCDFAHGPEDAWCPKCNVRGHFLNTPQCKLQYHGQYMYTRPHQFPYTMAAKTIGAPVQNRQALTVGAGRPMKEPARFMDISGADGRKLISNQWNMTKDLVFKVERTVKTKTVPGRDILSATPTLEHLQYISQRLAEHQGKWQQVCVNLGVPYERIKECEQVLREDSLRACVVAMEIWMKGETAKQATWAVLLGTLVESGLQEVAMDIEERLKNKGKMI